MLNNIPSVSFMALIDIFKISRKTFLNPTGWFGLDLFKMHNDITVDLVKSAVAKPVPLREETFKQAMVRLKVSEEELADIKNTYLFYSVVFLILGLIALVYSFYLLFVHVSISGWLIGLAVSALLISQTFRFHFWYFQIKERRLGFTFQDWWDYLRGKKGKTS